MISCLLGITMLFNGAIADSSMSPETTATETKEKIKYNFISKPYLVDPEIVHALAGSYYFLGESDIMSIELLESKDNEARLQKLMEESERIASTIEMLGGTDILFEEEPDNITVTAISGEHPLIEKIVECDDGTEEFGYQYIGATDSGIHILYLRYSGGGSGLFKSLIFLTLEYDIGIECDWQNLSVSSSRNRVVLKKLGLINLGDRWKGELRIIDGDKLFVGEDNGWFTVSGGTGGSWLSYDRKDRILSIEIER